MEREVEARAQQVADRVLVNELTREYTAAVRAEVREWVFQRRCVEQVRSHWSPLTACDFPSHPH